MDHFFCVPHAEAEALVPATNLKRGRSVCAAHRASRWRTSLIDVERSHSVCEQCLSTPHRAYFVVDGASLCIRHAADAAFGEDDMGAHDMAHASYIALNRLGVTDAY